MPSRATEERRLVAIVFSDVAGYTAMMAESEERARRVRRRHRELVQRLTARFGGEWIEEAGDQSLSCFPSAGAAVDCALALQHALRTDPELKVRIGIHVGDVVFEGGRVHGDGVNVAARIRPLAEPGGICVSAEVREAVRNQPEVEARPVGQHALKGVGRPVEVFALKGAPRAPRHRPRGHARRWPLVGAALLLVLAAALALSWPRPLSWLLGVARLFPSLEEPALPESPSLVVLPFENLSGDPDQDYLSDGITEELITDLASVARLFVISRSTAFAYKGRAVPVEDVGRQLGVRYVLEGSVRRADDRLRISAQLTDATTGFQIWSERFDRRLADVFELQSDISREILAALEIELTQAEIDHVMRRPTHDLRAYELFLRGFSHYRRFGREENQRARQLFERAAELDPGFAEAWALLGATYAMEYYLLWNLDRSRMARAEEMAERALALDPDSPPALTLASQVHRFHGRSAEATAAAERAVALAPNVSPSHVVLAFSLVAEGRHLVALEELQRALRLDPRPPHAYRFLLGYIHYATGRRSEAIVIWEALREESRDALLPRLALASHHAAAGRTVEARRYVEEILAVNSALTVEALSASPLVEEGPFDVTLLRNAGLP